MDVFEQFKRQNPDKLKTSVKTAKTDRKQLKQPVNLTRKPLISTNHIYTPPKPIPKLINKKKFVKPYYRPDNIFGSLF